MTPDHFGPRLRAERESRGISLTELAATTKVSVDLWEALERNDFSRWPAGVFARAFVRDYAQAIGLDADAVVNDFCRMFPIGDRRAIRIVRAKAQLIGHQHRADDAELLPAGRERRSARREPDVSSAPGISVYRPRLIAAAIDLACVTLLASVTAAILGTGLLASAGVLASAYYAVSTVATGASPGVRILEALRHRAPALFTSRPTVSA